MFFVTLFLYQCKRLEHLRTSRGKKSENWVESCVIHASAIVDYEVKNLRYHGLGNRPQKEETKRERRTDSSMQSTTGSSRFCLLLRLLRPKNIISDDVKAHRETQKATPAGVLHAVLLHPRQRPLQCLRPRGPVRQAHSHLRPHPTTRSIPQNQAGGQKNA